MVRTQLYLEPKMHRRLQALARKQGRTLSDLVREALARAYGADDPERRLRTLERVQGLWSDRSELGDTDAYVRRRRRDTKRVARTR